MKSFAGNKICSNCKLQKLVEDFPKHKGTSDGLDYWCRLCNKIKGRQWREKNKDVVKRIKEKWKNNNHRKTLEYHKTWRNKDKFKFKVGDYARHEVMKAVRNGTLKRKPCEKCGNKSQAHHPDYSKPLEVVWLCPQHHQLEHAK